MNSVPSREKRVLTPSLMDVLRLINKHILGDKLVVNVGEMNLEMMVACGEQICVFLRIL